VVLRHRICHEPVWPRQLHLQNQLASELLQQRRIAHWLEFGSLLGAVREAKCIPWDHDMDFGFFAEDRSKVVACHDAFRSLGLQLLELGNAVIRLQPVVSGNSGLLWVDFYACKNAEAMSSPWDNPGQGSSFIM
jgi:hypothetical protein